MAAEDLLDVMRSWVEERGQNGQMRPWLVFRSESSGDRAKQSAMIEIEDPLVMGQVILWDTGECEVDLGSTTDSGRTLLRSLHVASPPEVVEVLEDVIRFCEAESI